MLCALSCAMFLAFTSYSQSSVEYMNSVLEPIAELKKETWNYMKAVTKGKGARKVEGKRMELIMGLKNAKREVAKISDYKGDDNLRTEAEEYLGMSITVLEEDFGKILDMEDIAEQSYDLMEAYLLAKEKANDKLQAAGDELDAAQRTFADANDITLVEAESDKTSEKIKKAGKALRYYNEIYLIFFKVYKQEAYVIDAQNRQDVMAMEQNINTLKADAEAGLEKLAALEAFDGDKTLIAACKEAMEFYLDEAENTFPAMLNFYLAKDNFDKAKETFEATKKKDRTQKVVDKYNNAGKKYNEAVGEFNKVNESSNDERGDTLKNWNKSVDKFFSNHA
ncbi:hypothetical protein SAMN05216474_3017 [Lishizhenia tianjinensis]|uniref:Uncharacterized protein n=2 Tax=Lishizhenia tianjinensis TaxID=477690 RepID=A0A1I7BR61_9FLAO|nr:hypothetical protein SAMN05216474_3017 [Lishizhenia tianjinensis]